MADAMIEAANDIGIQVARNGLQVLNNAVSKIVKQWFGVARGICLAPVTGGLAVNNRITQAHIGIDFAGNGKYRDNLTFDVSTPFIGTPGL